MTEFHPVQIILGAALIMVCAAIVFYAFLRAKNIEDYLMSEREDLTPHRLKALHSFQWRYLLLAWLFYAALIDFSFYFIWQRESISGLLIDLIATKN